MFVITGDFNFQCKPGDKGYDVFSTFSNDLGLIACDNLDLKKIGYTYFHETLDQKSFIDHFFVQKELMSLIKSFTILESGANLSDHLPIIVKLAIPAGLNTNGGITIKNTVHEFRWDKGDLAGYYKQTGLLLNNIKHYFPCMRCDSNCNNNNCFVDIDIYYSEIVHCLMVAANCNVARIPSNALKHYWSAALEDLKNDSISAFNICGKSAGKPQSGHIFEMKKIQNIDIN